MIYYRCKCGNRSAWSSMGVADCERCEDCGSDLAEGSGLHKEPQPHRLIASIESGEVRVFCSQCLAKMGTLDEAENADEIREQIRKLQEVAL